MRMRSWRTALPTQTNRLALARCKAVAFLFSLVAIALCLATWPASVSAHSGGAPVLVDQPAGPYRVFAWLEPDPPRVGNVHLGIAVTLAPPPDAPPNPLVEPVTDANVQVTWTPQSQPGSAVVVRATPQSGLNGFYYEINTTVGVADLWHVEVLVQGPAGEGAASFAQQVLRARSVNWYVIAGAGVGLLALIGLLGLWNRLRAGAPQAGRISQRARMEGEQQ